MALIVFSEPIYRWWTTGHPHQDLQDNKTLDSLVASWNWDSPHDSLSKKPPTFFAFDPNTASLSDFINLGLPGKLSRRLMNYRQKGGKFRIKSDLRRVHGMDSSLVLKLYPFINLPEKIISSATPRPPAPAILSANRFDLNLADTAQLIKIFGIGPKRSRTIVKYRLRLGGFISLNQLTEVYGLDSASINQLKKKVFIREDFKPHQINVNTAGEKELSALPYIKFQLAKAITVYRFQHGNFDSVDELTKLALVDELLFEKIKPYLTVKD